MGLAATQTRFLSLTAKKSNIEYQGQQINQQRMTLSNKSAAAYSQMLSLSVPTPPSTSDFINVQYQFTDANGVTYQTTSVTDSEITATNMSNNEVKTFNVTELKTDDKTGRYTSFNGMAFSVVETVDYDAYEDAYNQYTYEQYLYEQEMENINAQTAVIQQQDKTLELQLNQLDTEQNAIKTELEALDKIIGDNVEGSFKTFGG